jgi:hypothetical protein
VGGPGTEVVQVETALAGKGSASLGAAVNLQERALPVVADAERDVRVVQAARVSAKGRVVPLIRLVLVVVLGGVGV